MGNKSWAISIMVTDSVPLKLAGEVPRFLIPVARILPSGSTLPKLHRLAQK